MNNQRMMLLASGLCASTMLAQTVIAQDVSAEGEEVMSVYERYRPDYDAPGMRTGSFLFYPLIEAGGKYNSNIFLEESNVTDDFVAVIKPSIALVSDWNSNYFSLFADADIGLYSDNGSEDYEDFTIGASGRRDISFGTELTADFSYNQGHEDRGSPDAVGLQESPTELSTLSAALGFKRDVSVLSLAIDGSFEKKDFDDTDLTGGGILNNDDRDRDKLKGTLRLGYELPNGYEAFIRGSMDRVEYDNSKEDGGPQRNSDGLELVAGAAFDLTGKAKGEFFAGYIKREYDSDTLGSVDGFNFGAELLWNLSGLTSFRGNIVRSIDETTIGGRDPVTDLQTAASGITSTLFSGRVEHELRRNVLMNVGGSYTRQEFELTTREDDLIEFGAGLKYLVNRNVRVNASYDYRYRDSTEVRSDYSQHALMLSVTAQW